MKDSLVGEYFDFGQALEFLREGIEVTNDNFNPHFRLLMKENTIIITNYVYVHNGLLDCEGETAVYEEMEDISVEDIINEKWHIYEPEI